MENYYNVCSDLTNYGNCKGITYADNTWENITVSDKNNIYHDLGIMHEVHKCEGDNISAKIDNYLNLGKDKVNNEINKYKIKHR